MAELPLDPTWSYAVLQRARGLARLAVRVGAEAETIDGQPVGATDPRAVRYSLLGAIIRAAHDTGPPSGRQRLDPWLVPALLARADGSVRVEFGVALGAFHGDPDRAISHIQHELRSAVIDARGTGARSRIARWFAA
jgi:hypothetical protein